MDTLAIFGHQPLVWVFVGVGLARDAYGEMGKSLFRSLFRLSLYHRVLACLDKVLTIIIYIIGILVNVGVKTRAPYMVAIIEYTWRATRWWIGGFAKCFYCQFSCECLATVLLYIILALIEAE